MLLRKLVYSGAAVLHAMARDLVHAIYPGVRLLRLYPSSRAPQLLTAPFLSFTSAQKLNGFSGFSRPMIHPVTAAFSRPSPYRTYGMAKRLLTFFRAGRNNNLRSRVVRRRCPDI